MPLERDLQAQLILWGLADTALGRSALDIARRLDVPGVRPAAAAMLHAQLRGYLVELAKDAPADAVEDALDELQARRAQRRKAAGIE